MNPSSHVLFFLGWYFLLVYFLGNVFSMSESEDCLQTDNGALVTSCWRGADSLKASELASGPVSTLFLVKTLRHIEIND